MYSHNAFAQIINTGIAKAGISGADMASFGTGSPYAINLLPFTSMLIVFQMDK
jgi:hypothetical protein